MLFDQIKGELDVLNALIHILSMFRKHGLHKQWYIFYS